MPPLEFSKWPIWATLNVSYGPGGKFVSGDCSRTVRNKRNNDIKTTEFYNIFMAIFFIKSPEVKNNQAKVALSLSQSLKIFKKVIWKQEAVSLVGM